MNNEEIVSYIEESQYKRFINSINMICPAKLILYKFIDKLDNAESKDDETEDEIYYFDKKFVLDENNQMIKFFRYCKENIMINTSTLFAFRELSDIHEHIEQAPREYFNEFNERSTCLDLGYYYELNSWFTPITELAKQILDDVVKTESFSKIDLVDIHRNIFFFRICDNKGYNIIITDDERNEERFIKLSNEEVDIVIKNYCKLYNF